MGDQVGRPCTDREHIEPMKRGIERYGVRRAADRKGGNDPMPVQIEHRQRRVAGTYNEQTTVRFVDRHPCRPLASGQNPTLHRRALCDVHRGSRVEVLQILVQQLRRSIESSKLRLTAEWNRADRGLCHRIDQRCKLRIPGRHIHELVQRIVEYPVRIVRHGNPLHRLHGCGIENIDRVRFAPGNIRQAARWIDDHTVRGGLRCKHRHVRFRWQSRRPAPLVQQHSIKPPS